MQDIYLTIATIFWDPNPDAFVIPFLERAVKWYGVLFALGCVLAYFILIVLFTNRFKTLYPSKTEAKIRSRTIVDRLAWYILIGLLVGAKLGHAFFYDWTYYKQHFLEIFMFWEPGLASHGAGVGILIALIAFYEKSKKNLIPIQFLGLGDLFIIIVPLVGCFIRLGNFMNQEILGSPTNLPWGVTFLHPIDQRELISRHPVQLYEAIAYFAIFLTLFVIHLKELLPFGSGQTFGLGIFLIFSARFFLEFFKSSQTMMIDETFLNMGQYLSLPFILLGIVLFFRNRYTNLIKTV